MQEENPFSVNITVNGMMTVHCNLPLVYFAGKNAKTAADKLASVLNKVFNETCPELTESMQEAEKLFADLAKRKFSWHMYLAVKAVLRTQRDFGQGPMDWQDIYEHPDFRFPPVIGSVFGEKPVNMRKVRKSIQGAVTYLQSKGVDVEVIRMPGKGLCYSLC